MGSARPDGEDSPRLGSVEPLPRCGPTALRLMLGGRLRRLREAKGMSRRDAARAIQGSETKVSRLELGRLGQHERDVARLLTLYGVHDAGEREEFLALARQASVLGWWTNYGDVLPSWLEMYVGLEQVASVVRTYQLQLLPGVFQTADYARAITRLGHPGTPAHEVEQRVQLRLRRQELLTEPGPPQVWAVVDEVALRRRIGGPGVMRAQLERLLELTELPNVTLQVIPFDAGGLVVTSGPFTILRFADHDINDVVYLEQLTSAHYVDQPSDIDTYTILMDQLTIVATSATGTREFLEELLRTS